mgnify:FL=1
MNTMVPLRFASLGFDYVVCVSKIWMVIRFDSKQGYKIYRAAKRDDRFVDFTFHRKTKSLIVMDNNTVIGCAFSVGTVYRRIMRACNEAIVFDNRDTFVEPGADEELNDIEEMEDEQLEEEPVVDEEDLEEDLEEEEYSDGE